MVEATHNAIAAFSAALRASQNAVQACHYLQGNAETNTRRLAIYRGNVVAGITQALTAHYPVIAQLVGDEFFKALARAYWQAFPSKSGDLGDYGTALPEFLADFSPSQHLPYLPDVARLEWAVHKAETAADAPAQAITREPALLWMPGSQLLKSVWPIASIWLAHQTPAALALADVQWQAEGALVYREGWRVSVSKLNYPETEALMALTEPEFL
jgi:hypothetical protein